MAWSLFGFTYFPKSEKRLFSKGERLMIQLHERFHRRRFWHPNTYREEQRAFIYSVREMLKHGYKLETAVFYEMKYRIWDKYDKFMEELIDEITTTK